MGPPEDRPGLLLADRETYMIDGHICIDYFIRFERLEQGIAKVCDTLGLPFEPDRIPRLKTGFRPAGLGIADHYTSDSLALVAEAYAFEIQTFGYHPPEL